MRFQDTDSELDGVNVHKYPWDPSYGKEVGLDIWSQALTETQNSTNSLSLE